MKHLTNPESFSFLFLGNSTFRGLYHREHGIATELARQGYRVYFIEEMPSLASRIRRWIRHEGTTQSRTHTEGTASLLPNLFILTPPVVPTFFRSSYVPTIDQFLFRRWFGTMFCDFDWTHSVLIVTLPYWWGGFVDKRLCPARTVVYDWHDSLEVPSRNATALRRMTVAEHLLLQEADLVTCTAGTMVSTLSDKSDRKNIHFLPNAISSDYVHSVTTRQSGRARRTLGYLGSLDNHWIDTELLLKVALHFNDCDLEIIGPVDRRLRRLFRPAANVHFCGFVDHEGTPQLLQNCDVLLIPLRQNQITDVLNPLKLYEYCATGHPIVATRTKELEQYARYVYLANAHDEFIGCVKKALEEEDSRRRSGRIAFAKSNTWTERVTEFLALVNSYVSPRE